MDSNLLITKTIVPSRRGDALRRPRLLDFCHEYIDRKLLLVSASAGYGKTSLLIDFAHDTQLPVCWYSLDSADQDPQVFLEYLVAAIQRRFPQFGGRTTALLRNLEDKHSLDACIAALVTDIQAQIEEFFVIVLDDYHLVENSEPINQLIDRLLYFMPENAHLILSSRTIPARLTLTRLTAKMQVAGLGVGELRFTPDEIRALVQTNYGLEITPTIANDLAAQSEGWITGIVLTTPTLWRGLFHDWVKGYGPGSQLFEYLAVEVLSQQPTELQEFLMETAVLTEMDVTLCNELLGRTDAQELLQQAEKRNLFLTRLEEEGYRYHHLFREFLQARLKQSQPVRYQTLLRQAAAVFERRGKMDRAIEQWFTAGDAPNAARLIAIVAQDYFEGGRWITLTRWLDALPTEVLRNMPALLLLRASIAAEAGEMETAQEFFAEALTRFEQVGDTLNVVRTLLESARNHKDLERAVLNCERALAILPRHEFLLQGQCYDSLGVLRTRQLRWTEAIQLFERAAACFEMANNRTLQSDMENHLGIVYTFLGDRARAQGYLQDALRNRRQLDHPAKLAAVLNTMAVLYTQEGNLAQATELLQEALTQARRAGQLRLEAYALASLGDIYRDQGEFSEALQAYSDSSDMAEKSRENPLITYTRIAVGEIWRLCEDLKTAGSVLETALHTATAHHSDYEVGQVQLALGALRIEQNEPEAARRQLESALPAFERVDAKREIGRTRFYLASAALQLKQEPEAVTQLRSLAELGRALNEDQFLVSDAAHSPHVLSFALRQRLDTLYFQPLATKSKRVAKEEVEPIVLVESGWPYLEIFTLGEARVVMDSMPIAKGAWQTATTKELFFFFATNPRGWRKEQVIDQLWADAPRGQANDLFHSSVYRIRRALFPECLVYRNGMYQLNPEAGRWLDVQEFEQTLDAVQNLTDTSAKIERLELAIALYNGDFLSEFYSDWSMLRREQLRTRFLDGLSQLGRLWLAQNNSRQAIEVFQQLVRADPLHEAAYRDLIALYVASGNRAAAIQTYQLCVERLEQELGVPPMPETIALYEQALAES